jgi:hypothetical protein
LKNALGLILHSDDDGKGSKVSHSSSKKDKKTLRCGYGWFINDPVDRSSRCILSWLQRSLIGEMAILNLENDIQSLNTPKLYRFT